MSTGRAALKHAKRLYDRLAKSDAPLFLWLHLFDAHQKYLRHEGIDFGNSSSDRYDGEIAFVDRQVGRLVQHVAAGKRAERTTWIVHGSHGEGFGEHGARGHGTELYNEMLRVPLIIAGASVDVGRYQVDAVSTLDIAPTLLDFASADRKGTAGQSLKAIAYGNLRAERAPIIAHAWRRSCVIDWPLKLMVIGRAKKRDRLLLFDLAGDPHELRDVSAERSDDVRRMNALREGLS
jgi:arylsulfatase A-like enzyme